MRALDIATSLITTVLRLGAGMAVSGVGSRPAKRLELFEFESCPFCRKVREELTRLDLEAVVYPCPKRGKRYRPELGTRGGKEQFPYLVDPNTGAEMYESDAIVRYLRETYGDGSSSISSRLGPLNDASSVLSGVARAVRGAFARPSTCPDELLELWSFEASPFCRLVRERLCELEIPYVLHNVGKGSAVRAAFVENAGKMQVPYLFDPNMGIGLYESGDILEYLEDTYGAPA
jgi:glutathione S-transferase